jgi:hypothetical protein
MHEAGIVGRSRQRYWKTAERLRSHGIEIVPFLTVACLVAGFWFTLSLPGIVHALGLRTEPAHQAARAAGKTALPDVQLRVIASFGGAEMPELLRVSTPNGTAKASRERGETPVPASLPVATR